MISVDDAVAIIAAHGLTMATERTALADAAGRVLAQAVVAERDQPPFDRVTMDGAAIRWQPKLTELRVAGTQLAGDAPQTLEDAPSAIEIMTGAALPPGADTIVPVERFDVLERDGHTLIRFDDGYAAERGQFIHRRGSDHRAGTTLLSPGARIGANELAVIASAGLARVAVSRRPAIAIVATGNELVAAGKPIADHQVRLSNGPALVGALELAGFPGAGLHHLNDDRDALRGRLGELLAENDVLILSGGVSKGKADHVPEVLAALGVEKHFHRIAQRPGKPMWFGTGPDGQMVFALPGNPVSTLTCFRRYVIDALNSCCGMPAPEQEFARLATDWQFKPALTALLAVRARTDASGALIATPVATNTSGDFTALAGTSGILQLPAERSEFAAAEVFPLFRW